MTSDNPADEMRTITEVARFLHVHPTTLRRWSDKGIIDSYSITRRGDRRFTSHDIDQFLAKMNGQNHR